GLAHCQRARVAAIHSPPTPRRASDARRSALPRATHTPSAIPCGPSAPLPSPSTISTVTDPAHMDQALREPRGAFARGDWPVGSGPVRDGVVLATGQNRQNTERDVTWHAEFEAMRRAAREHGEAILTGATVYSTMEPCPMCAGAMKLAGIAPCPWHAALHPRPR